MKIRATILVSGDILLVLVTASKRFRRLACKLGGKWNGVGYVFPTALQEQIEERCLAMPAFDSARPENQPDAS